MGKARDRHFDEFEPHTRLKHLIWDRYLKAWAQKLLGWGRAGERLWIVDAFAGAGQDDAGNPGSPKIAATIARAVAVARRSDNPESRAIIHVVALEKDVERADDLRANIAEFLEGDPPVADVRTGTLAEFVDRIMTAIGDEPAMFFLDPFGIAGMQAELLPRLLAGPHNEIFALFSDTGATRLHSVLAAEDVSPDEAVSRAMPEPSLFPEHDAEDAAEIRRAAERRASALGYTRPAAKRILDQAFGGDWWLNEIKAVAPADRPLHFVRFYMQLMHRAGARAVIAIPVRDDANRRVYHLVYASKSAQGLRTMKQSIATALRASELPAAVRESMVLDLNIDLDQVAAQIAKHFAGQHVSWTDSANKRVLTVRNYALENTGVFPAQCSALRDALAARYKMDGTRANPVFTFPSAGASAEPLSSASV